MAGLRWTVVGLTAVIASPSAADELCGRPITSFARFEAALARDPRMKGVPNGGADFTAYQDEPLRMWFVTKPHFPEVKAVICRRIEQDKGEAFLAVDSRCFGDKVLCDRLVAAFSKVGD